MKNVWELVVVVAFFGVLFLIGYVMYKLLDAGVAFWKARREANRNPERVCYIGGPSVPRASVRGDTGGGLRSGG